MFQHTVNKAFQQVEGFEYHPLISLRMEKGDTVFFYPILVHGSVINRTNVNCLTRSKTQNKVNLHFSTKSCCMSPSSLVCNPLRCILCCIEVNT
jgi:ectoine hydroxylase-related dioxygenase (phytanoyl-CoA dioxygenase family)